MLYAILIVHFLNSVIGINRHTDLSRRHLTEIPQNIPVDTEILDLSYNEIQIIPNNIFSNLSEVLTLDLSFNKINTILVGSFKGLSRIESLSLQTNNLTCKSLQVGSFQKITSLKRLDISHNAHESDKNNIVFSDELYQLRLLSTLCVDGIDTNQNQLNKFKCFKNLKNLTFYSSKGMNVTSKTFEGLEDLPIEELSISSVEVVQNNSLSFFRRLQKLTLISSFTVEKVFPAFEAFKGRRMTAITLFGNTEHDYYFILGKHLRFLEDICLTELHLCSSNIIDIDPSNFKAFAKKSTCLEVFDMSDNPLTASMHPYWYMYLNCFTNLKVIQFSHIGLCSKEHNALRYVNISNFAYNIFLPSTLQEVSVHYGSSRDGLPFINFINGQSLKYLSLFQIKMSDCLGGFRGIENLTELNISGFNCTYLNPDILQFLPLLEKFTARNSNLNHGFNLNNKSGARLFVHLSYLNYVDLSANNLKSLHSDIFKNQQKTLRHLNLSNNAFKNIPIGPNKIKNLEVLDLSSNRIEYFNNDDQTLMENDNIDIRLSRNLIACTCNQRKFLRWIKNRRIKFFQNLECIDEGRIWHNISEMISSLDNFELHCILSFWLYFAICMSFICCVLVLFCAIYFRYRSAIQYFYLKIKMKMKRYNALEQLDTYQFDAFICYSSKDSSWVTKFYRQMTDNGFRLCIDAKDFLAGDAIAENIVRAIDTSRKIIFIVTRNFLKSSWGGYEIEMTRMHAFREGRENMVILIIKDEIRIDEMPRALKEMWDKIVCLQYCDEDETVFYNSVSLCLR